MTPERRDYIDALLATNGNPGVAWYEIAKELREALAVLGRQLAQANEWARVTSEHLDQANAQLAEKDEALRSILDVTTRWSAKMSLENQIALIDMLAREALRAEPAKEEA